MAVANNADDYAASRVNIFFTANNSTPINGNLTGQCVTLLKWFFAEMCDGFPSPFAARGDARYVGQNLVNQGLAVEVPYSDRRRGDVICYLYGTYGHIALQLSNGQVFEENVNWSGVKSMVVDGETVYASRIGSEAEAWRATKNPHVYRIKSYNENGANMATQVTDDITNLLYSAIFHRNPEDAGAYSAWRGRDVVDVMTELRNNGEWQTIDNGIHDNAVYKDRFQKLADLLGLDINTDGLDGIVAAVHKLKEAGGGEASLPAGTYLKVEPANIKVVK